MASIETLLGSDDQPRAYKVAWRDANGKEKTKTLRLKRDALALRAAMESAKLEGVLPNLAEQTITVERYAARWSEAQGHRPGTAKRAGGVMAQLVRDFGPRAVATIGQTDVKGWVKRRARQVKASTLASEWIWVRALFAAAVADGIRRTSPCAGVDLPRAGKPKRVTVPTFEVLDALGAALPHRLQGFLWVSARTGLRPGELRGLTVGQVDFFRHTITVDRQASDAGGLIDPATGRPYEPKTEASHRVVPIDSGTTEIIAAHLAAYPAPSTGIIFSTVHGAAYHSSSVSAAYRAAIASAGIPAKVTPHGGRHFYASVLIAEGVRTGRLDPLMIRDRLGHATLAETMDTYGHLFPDAEDVTRDLIAGAFSRAAAYPRPIGSAQASDQGF